MPQLQAKTQIHFPAEEESEPVLGSAAGGLRFEPVLDIPPAGKTVEDLEEPFAVLNDVGIYSRVLLARVAMGEDSTIRHLALKMQRSDYPHVHAAEKLTNPEIEVRWELERRHLAEFIQTGEEIVELSELRLSFEAVPTGTTILPITFCKRIKRFFHPICPQCMSFLRDCRDESLLASNGLPSYERSSVRYLYCPRCSQMTSGAGEIIFYSHSKTAEEPPATRAKVLRRSELYRGWREIFTGREELGKQKNMEKRAGEIFPCFDCEHQAGCYPQEQKSNQAIPAERLLYPVSFYEFRALPLQLLHLRYDDFCDLLGGATWDEFKQIYRNRGTTSGQTLVMSGLEPTLSSSHQFIFQDDHSGLFPLEVLRLKMIAFTQLCHGVRAIHRRCRQPHLDLNPANVMVFIPPSGRDLPARWNFQIKILDLAATVAFEPVHSLAEIFQGIFLPPHNYHRLYTSPIIQNFPFGRQENLNVTIKKIDEEAAPERRMIIEADLISDHVPMTEFSERDVLRLVLNSPAYGLEEVEFWGRKTGEMPRGGLSVRGALPAMHNGIKAALEKSLGQTLPNCRVAFYKSYFTPCDVYSLGMMLLRTLLVNDRTDLAPISEAVKQVVQRLTLALDPMKKEANDDLTVDRLRRWLRADEYQDFFLKSAVLYRQEHRKGMRNAIPDELWQNILIFAFRLVTNIRGFSICADHGDYDPENPEAVMERVRQLLDNINTAIHAEIFGSKERNREIGELCNEVLAELSQAEAANL